jgi:hypothetical protein
MRRGNCVECRNVLRDIRRATTAEGRHGESYDKSKPQRLHSISLHCDDSIAMNCDGSLAMGLCDGIV